MDEAIRKWKSRWHNSILEFFLLSEISQSSKFGGELVEKAQEKVSNEIKIATVYSILNRTTNLGLLIAENRKEKAKITRGMSRRYYKLSNPGKMYLEQIKNNVKENLRLLDQLLQVITNKVV